MSHSIHNISPLDGRYADTLTDLSSSFSEFSLMKYRMKVEIEYLIALGNERKISDLKPFSDSEQKRIRKIYGLFNPEDGEKIKEIEKSINHDVKAIEYFIQRNVKQSLHPWIHFALTSEDVNNLAYTLMWKESLENIYLPALNQINGKLKRLVKKYQSISMLSMTHGQPATPTTFGKEVAVFSNRLGRQIDQMTTHEFLGKFGGATGTWSAQAVAYPEVNWIDFSKKFIQKMGMKLNPITTQIEPHDSLIESYHQMIRVNAILIDFCRDIWTYISRGVLGQKKISGETGSSTMPHKINPIQFENAEGNLGISNALLIHFTTKLPVSRMQRDLTDSTTIRNQGVAMGHSFLALENILKGLDRITINQEKISAELNDHWEVLAEAIQTMLRKAGQSGAYEQLKALTRGQKMDQKIYLEFVSGLAISEDDKTTLMALSPENYIGLASKLANLV
ncbi:MAG: adenylosuccinate lyase [Fidelibacterota bacterium]